MQQHMPQHVGQQYVSQPMPQQHMAQLMPQQHVAQPMSQQHVAQPMSQQHMAQLMSEQHVAKPMPQQQGAMPQQLVQGPAQHSVQPPAPISPKMYITFFYIVFHININDRTQQKSRDNTVCLVPSCSRRRISKFAMFVEVGNLRMKICNFNHLKDTMELTAVMGKVNNAARDLPVAHLDGTEVLSCANGRCAGPIKVPIVSVFPNVGRADELCNNEKKLFCSTQCFDNWCQYTRTNYWDKFCKLIEPETNK